MPETQAQKNASAAELLAKINRKRVEVPSAVPVVQAARWRAARAAEAAQAALAAGLAPRLKNRAVAHSVRDALKQQHVVRTAVARAHVPALGSWARRGSCSCSGGGAAQQRPVKRTPTTRWRQAKRKLPRT